MQGYIYSLKNTVTEKIYIGKTVDVYQRHATHLSKLRANEHTNQPLQDDFNEYGESVFEFSVIEETDDIDNREIHWIQHHYANSYNIQHCRPAYVSKMDEMPSILNRIRRRGIEAAKSAE